jgi:hypothetical protein
VSHSDFGIVGFGGWSRYKNESRAFTGSRTRPVDQAFADALVLIGNVDRQVRKIAAIGKISDGARDADQSRAVACRYDDIGLTQHPFQPFQVIDWPTLAQCRGNKNVAKFLCRQIGLKSISYLHRALPVWSPVQAGAGAACTICTAMYKNIGVWRR